MNLNISDKFNLKKTKVKLDNYKNIYKKKLKK